MNYEEAFTGLLKSVRDDLEAEASRALQAEVKAALLEAEAAHLHDTHDLVAQAQQVLQDLTTWREVNEVAMRSARIEADLRHYRGVDLPASKENLETVVADATLAAYAEGAASGKNQAERDVQLTAYLAKHQAVIAARSALAEDTAHIAECEACLAVADAEHKGTLNRWNAARAQAELLAAMLTAVAGK